MSLSMKKNIEPIEILLKKGANVEVRNKSGGSISRINQAIGLKGNPKQVLDSSGIL